MANYNIEEIVQAPEGETTSDDVVKANVVQEIIEKQADLISVGTEIVPEREFSALDVDFSYPGEIEGEYPVDENSVVDRERVVWNEFDLTLEQAEARFMLTDIARVREQESIQNEMSIQRAAEAIAEEKDYNILETLNNGAPTTTSITLNRSQDEGWDQDGGDPEADIVQAWNNIFDHSNVNENDSQNTYVVAPASTFGTLNSLQLINNVQQTLRDYIEDAYGINIRFSRHVPNNDAIVAVGGNQTAIHGVLDSDEIEAVETQRVFGRGDDWLMRQFFNTAVVEDEGLNNESYRLSKIENVVA
ncbi:MAG: hypothetical protein ABEH81_01030 [Halopenitus sp.]